MPSLRDNPGKDPETRAETVLPNSREELGRTVWWWAQSAANPSPPNSLLNRENTGNFRDSGPVFEVKPPESSLLSRGIHGNNFQNKQGISLKEQGIPNTDQGTHLIHILNSESYMFRRNSGLRKSPDCGITKVTTCPRFPRLFHWMMGPRKLVDQDTDPLGPSKGSSFQRRDSLRQRSTVS